MIEQTIERLKHMRLGGIARALQEQLESTQYSDLSFEERITFIVEKEFHLREDRMLARNLKEAALKQPASIENIDFDAKRNIKRAQIMELAQCTWIQKKHNLIITGPTGVGKSFIACALAEKACRIKLKAKYIKATELARALLLAHADGTYPKLRKRLAAFHLLVIDEWLRDPLSQEQAREILDLIDDRFRRSSTIFASQLPVPDWHKAITDPTLADALLDRVIHDAHRITLSGESIRKRTADIS